MEVRPGLYKHFKGKQYRVIDVARHSETLELVIVYRALYHSPEFGAHPLFVRPSGMWGEAVDRDGYSGPRFVFVSDSGPFNCADCGKSV